MSQVALRICSQHSALRDAMRSQEFTALLGGMFRFVADQVAKMVLALTMIESTLSLDAEIDMFFFNKI